jgi:hypothetical protein
LFTCTTTNNNIPSSCITKHLTYCLVYTIYGIFTGTSLYSYLPHDTSHTRHHVCWDDHRSVFLTSTACTTTACPAATAAAACTTTTLLDWCSSESAVKYDGFWKVELSESFGILFEFSAAMD